MPITLRPEKEKKPKTYLGLSIFIFIIVLVLALGGYWALFYFNEKLSDEKNQLTKEVEDLKTTLASFEEKKTEAEVVQKKLSSLEIILEDHLCFSNLFKEIEKLTVKKVYFTKIMADSVGHKIILTGRAETYEDIGKQFALFRDSDKFTDYEISEASLKTEEEKSFIEFTGSLTLASGFLKCEVK